MKNYKLRIADCRLWYECGFTLIELLIVIAITLILVVVAVPIYGNLRGSSQLDENTSLLIQSLRITQERSMVRFNNAAHGIKLFSDSYVLYHGSSYAARTGEYDRIIDLGETVDLEWSLSGTGQSDEVNFSKSLGVPDMTGSITLTYDNGGTRVVSINMFGAVEED